MHVGLYCDAPKFKTPKFVLLYNWWNINRLYKTLRNIKITNFCSRNASALFSALAKDKRIEQFLRFYHNWNQPGFPKSGFKSKMVQIMLDVYSGQVWFSKLWTSEIMTTFLKVSDQLRLFWLVGGGQTSVKVLCYNVENSMKIQFSFGSRHRKRRGHADIVCGKFWELWKFLECGRLITFILE